MTMMTNLWPPHAAQMTPEETAEVNSGINGVLVEMGREQEPITGWWLSAQFSEVGNLTLAEAWLRGDHQGVREVLASLQTGTQLDVTAAMTNPAFVARIRATTSATPH